MKIISDLTWSELLPYAGIIIVILVIFISNYRSGFQKLFSPLTFIAAVFAYYCVLGTYENITTGQTFDRLLNMRQFYESALWGAFISLICIVLGYKLKNSINGQSLRSVPVDRIGYYGNWIFLVGIILFTISTKGNIVKLINPLNAEAVEMVSGSFANYLNLCLNFLIPGVTLLFVYLLRSKKGFVFFIISFLISIGLFITLGFRYRILLIIISLFISYYLMMHQRPNLIVLGVGAILFVSLMGVINLTRSYGKGLSLDRLKDNGTAEYYESGLVEARIFQTSGAIIDIVPEKYPYVKFTPIISTILFPIPRVLYQEKGSAEYVFDALDVIYGKKISKGAAFMMYAEHYLAFGWIGLIIGSFLIGWFYKKLWLWYILNAHNPLVIVAYAVTVSYVYVIISRGYLPQVTMLFFFSVFPAYAVIWFAKGKSADGRRKPGIIHAN